MNGNIDMLQSTSRRFDAASLAPVSTIGLLLRLLENGLAAGWIKHIRNLQRAGRLPPQLRTSPGPGGHRPLGAASQTAYARRCPAEREAGL
jgi:hypothetical protein